MASTGTIGTPVDDIWKYGRIPKNPDIIDNINPLIIEWEAENQRKRDEQSQTILGPNDGEWDDGSSIAWKYNLKEPMLMMPRINGVDVYEVPRYFDGLIQYYNVNSIESAKSYIVNPDGHIENLTLEFSAEYKKNDPTKPAPTPDPDPITPTDPDPGAIKDDEFDFDSSPLNVIGGTTNTGDNITKVSMRLFGMPYQMPYKVDPRDKAVNSAIGKNYLEKFIIEAPILTVIPGDPLFMPESSGSKKAGAAKALLQAADSGKFGDIISKTGGNNIRLYDFEKAYRQYMKYVNLLCRVGASYLDLNASISINGSSTQLQNFDWKKYKWNNVTSNPQNFVNWISGKITTQPSTAGSGSDSSITEVLNDYDYVQFYIDPDSISNDDMGNASSESMMKGLFDGVGSKTKELAWMLRNSDAWGDMTNFATESVEDLSAFITEALTGTPGDSLTTAISRIINLSSNVVMGENVIIPNIYSNSTYNKSGFSATIHLKAPYGNKLSYYMDVFVPMMHLVALTIPRQSSSNTYSSPFLCKSYVEGSWSCNLGLVSGLSIAKSNESRSIHGLPSEVDVTIQFEDLYSVLSMNPTTDIGAFAKNPSLIEYLATNTGVSLTKANAEKKIKTIFDSVVAGVLDVPGNAFGAAANSIFEASIGRLRGLTKLT